MKLVIDLCGDEGCQVAVGKGLIFIEGFTVVVSAYIMTCLKGLDELPKDLTRILSYVSSHVHLSKRSRNLGPDVVNLRVQLLQSKDLERVIRFRQEADETSRRWKANHPESMCMMLLLI